MALTIDEIKGILVTFHPVISTPRLHTTPISFGALSVISGASVEDASTHDPTMIGTSVYMLKSTGPAAYLYEVNMFTGNVLQFAQVTDQAGNATSGTVEALAFDGTVLIIGRIHP